MPFERAPDETPAKARPGHRPFYRPPFTRAEGGGYLVEYPDIPGCMSHGATVAEAIAHGKEALRDTLAVFQESGRKLPRPAPEAAQWRQRLPRTPYAKLSRQAESEGVSINSLVTSIIAEAVGVRQARSAGKRRSSH